MIHNRTACLPIVGQYLLCTLVVIHRATAKRLYIVGGVEEQWKASGVPEKMRRKLAPSVLRAPCPMRLGSPSLNSTFTHLSGSQRHDPCSWHK